MFTLPDLPYSYNALEPYIDEETMRIHHDKHHATYIDNLNKLVKGTETISELLRSKDQGILNNLGGHLNHSFFWKIMSPKPQNMPEGELRDAIDSTFGSLETFKEAFTKKAMTVFGSGWAFLIKTRGDNLKLKRHSFQNSPLMQGNVPLLGIDVWEHAYYIQYRWQRFEYIKNWWNIVNWKEVEKNYLRGLTTFERK